MITMAEYMLSSICHPKGSRMSPDAPWIERIIFYGFHLHNSWLFLPATSLACFAVLLLLRQRSCVRISIYSILILSFAMLPLLVYSAKDVSTMLAHASQGYARTLMYAYFVIGLPTLILFAAGALLLALDGQMYRATGGSTEEQSASTGSDVMPWWKVVAVVLLGMLCLFQSLWLFHADASL